MGEKRYKAGGLKKNRFRFILKYLAYLHCRSQYNPNLCTMPSYRWRQLPADETLASELHETLRIQPVFCRLLAQRDITNYDAARSFFRPRLDELHHPFLMTRHGARRRTPRPGYSRKRTYPALRRLRRGRHHQCGPDVRLPVQRSTTTSTTTCPTATRRATASATAGVEYARDTGATLVVAMDCGIKAHKLLRWPNHTALILSSATTTCPKAESARCGGRARPETPRLPYPYKELSGCGMAFKLAQALALRRDNACRGNQPHLLDLVAVSICCDLVPMTGENRVLAALRPSKTQPRPAARLVGAHPAQRPALSAGR
jgi:single-stranded-DNA-specific exonuclease